MSGVENIQMLISTYMASSNLRYELWYTFPRYVGCSICYVSAAANLNVRVCIVICIEIAGILFPLGDACFGRHLWFTNLARSAGDHCWTSVPLLDRVASIGRWKEHIEDSKMGVSLLFI